MSPLSLLFSSDEETSRRLRQALRELELEVEHCPEIFGAVERLTGRSFDVIVADWDDGPEASFLLKTSRELKSNRMAFAIAIADADACTAAYQSGANLVLSKPIFPDKVKYALLTCDEFLVRMKEWLPKLGFPAPETKAIDAGGIHAVASQPRLSLVQKKPISPPPTERLAKPSPVPSVRSFEESLPALPRFATAEGRLFRRPQIQTIFSQEHSEPTPQGKKPRNRSFLRGTALTVAFLSVGYAFSESARSEAVAASVVKICGRALEKTETWLHTTGDEDADSTTLASEMGQNENSQPARSRNNSPRIRVTPATDVSLTDQAALPDEQGPASPMQLQPENPQIAVSTGPLIPESLKAPIEGPTLRPVAAKSPSFLSALEPVNLPADSAEKLLLQRVQPGYPQQALQAGLQGPVVLQAWIGRDGTIRDLKLIQGSLLLGQSAYRAVKQWRYRPYFLNGRAVEAQTLVTVNFRLPQ